MQEPTLFNYSLKENILYGKLDATNDDIVDAVKISNAYEFINDKDLQEAFDDQASSLLEAFESATHKEVLINDLG